LRRRRIRTALGQTPEGAVPKKIPKEYRELVDAAKEQRWGVDETENGFRLLAPDGVHAVMFHMTESKRGFQNTVSRMRRHGFRWRGR
jgi:hypothetical protein